MPAHPAAREHGGALEGARSSGDRLKAAEDVTTCTILQPVRPAPRTANVITFLAADPAAPVSGAIVPADGT
jgi:hypothetical protein